MRYINPNLNIIEFEEGILTLYASGNASDGNDPNNGVPGTDVSNEDLWKD